MIHSAAMQEFCKAGFHKAGLMHGKGNYEVLRRKE